LILIFSGSILANPYQSTDKTQLSNLLIEYLRKEHDKSSIDYLEPLTPLEKGAGGSLLSFKLKNPPPKLTNKLILRFSNAVPLEGTIQKQLKTQNYPVPTIHHLCTDKNIMGGPFLIRDYIKGDVLSTESSNEKKALHMAENQIILHSTHPQPVIKALNEANVDKISYIGSSQIEHFILEKELIGFELPPDWELENDISWLEPGGLWMRDNKPGNRKDVVCHCDFHPGNIIINSGRVEAVIDWQLCRVNELEFDIASTLHILLLVWPFLGVNVNECSDLVKKYLEMYREKIDINEDRLDYHMGVRCLLGLCGMELGFEVFRTPGVYEGQVKKFEEISGIRLNRTTPT
jgi:aminoglycoside phosphotransferase (APT) family kinase protein